MRYGDGDLERIRRECETWRRFGATHVFIGTGGAGLAFPDAHLEALRKGNACLALVVRRWG